MIWNPWRRIKQLQHAVDASGKTDAWRVTGHRALVDDLLARIDKQQERIAELEADAVRNAQAIESMQRHGDLLADRYDKIRVTNEQLRGALDLYRDDHRRH